MSLVLLRKLDNRFQADVWCEALERSGVPYLIRTYQDTAYDSLYVTQKGYASLFVEDAWLERAKQVDRDLEASSLSRPGDEIDLARRMDHCLLDPVAGMPELRQFVKECLEMGCASACVPPWLVSKAAPRLAGSPVAVCSVVGFPTGCETSKSKCLEAQELAAAGAQELDVCLNRGMVLEGRIEQAVAEMQEVAQAAGSAIIKVVLEARLLGPDAARQVTEALADSQAVSLVASGSGVYGPADPDTVTQLREAVGGMMGVKASGGISGLDNAIAMIEAGADRIGSSRGYDIWREAKRRWPPED